MLPASMSELQLWHKPPSGSSQPSQPPRSPSLLQAASHCWSVTFIIYARDVHGRADQPRLFRMFGSVSRRDGVWLIKCP